MCVFLNCNFFVKIFNKCCANQSQESFGGFDIFITHFLFAVDRSARCGQKKPDFVNIRHIGRNFDENPVFRDF